MSYGYFGGGEKKPLRIDLIKNQPSKNLSFLVMASNGGSRRLVDLAKQLRLHNPTLRKTQIPPHQSETPGKRAAVLICLFEGEEDGELRVILTKRSSTLSSHSGEVALPGGKTDEGDADDIQTALREAEEEIGLDPSLVEVVAILEPLINKRGITIIPVIGILANKKAFHPVPNAAEVEAIFDAPLEMFLKDENRWAQESMSEGKKYTLHFFDYDAGDKKYLIWALTAEILIRAASIVYQRPPAFTGWRPHYWDGNLQSRY